MASLIIIIINPMKNTQASLKATLLGMDEHSGKLLVKLFNGPLRGYCDVVSDDTADFAIFDMDSHGAHELWLDYKKEIDMPAIVLSLKETRFPDTICVLKPLQVAELLAALNKIRPRIGGRKQRIQKRALIDRNPRVRREVLTHLSEQPHKATFKAAELAYTGRDFADLGGDIEDKWYQQEKLADKLLYAPELHLQGIVASAVEEVRQSNRAVILRGLGKDIIVFAGGRHVQTGMTPQQLRAICNINFDERYIEFLIKRNQPVNEVILRRRAIRSESFLWYLSLWSSRGRLPHGADIDKPFILCAWPNLTRLPRSPHAMQLAALWYRQAISLRATVVLLNIPAKYIYIFYSACSQQGLICERSRVEAPLSTMQKNPSQGILARLMGFLRHSARS